MTCITDAYLPNSLCLTVIISAGTTPASWITLCLQEILSHVDCRAHKLNENVIKMPLFFSLLISHITGYNSLTLVQILSGDITFLISISASFHGAII